jgi:hypothetical protein
MKDTNSFPILSSFLAVSFFVVLLMFFIIALSIYILTKLL